MCARAAAARPNALLSSAPAPQAAPAAAGAPAVAQAPEPSRPSRKRAHVSTFVLESRTVSPATSRHPASGKPRACE